MKLSSAVLLLSSSVVASSPASQINNTGDANNDNASQKLRGSSGAPVADGFDDRRRQVSPKSKSKSFENQLMKGSCIRTANPTNHPNDKGVWLDACGPWGGTRWSLDTSAVFGGERLQCRGGCLGTDIDGDTYYLILEDCDDNDTSQRWTLQDDGRIRNQRYGQYIGVTGYGERLELQDEIKFVICGFTITQWPTALQQKWFW
mmetsp:Transcript_4189/g.6661  ORF Transcript_4189/g.6661 Transcript_4189/m.6661 type:complete len:203 (-) Transcript_4189:313-921(-)